MRQAASSRLGSPALGGEERDCAQGNREDPCPVLALSIHGGLLTRRRRHASAQARSSASAYSAPQADRGAVWVAGPFGFGYEQGCEPPRDTTRCHTAPSPNQGLPRRPALVRTAGQFVQRRNAGAPRASSASQGSTRRCSDAVPFSACVPAFQARRVPHRPRPSSPARLHRPKRHRLSKHRDGVRQPSFTAAHRPPRPNVLRSPRFRRQTPGSKFRRQWLTPAPTPPHPTPPRPTHNPLLQQGTTPGHG